MRLPISPLPLVTGLLKLTMVFHPIEFGVLCRSLYRFCTWIGDISQAGYCDVPRELLSGVANVLLGNDRIPQVERFGFCPVIARATVRGAPANSMLRAAERRRS